jgi:hypothetical protein
MRRFSSAIALGAVITSVLSGCGGGSNNGDVQAAREHVLLMEGKNKLRPDHVIFQSWTPNPTHAMPETDPNALTSLVDFYFSKQEKIGAP